MEQGIYNTTYEYLIDTFETEHRSERSWEPENLLARRLAAFQHFNLKGFPSVKNEDWRFTNLNRLLKENFKFSNPGNVQAPAKEEIEGLDACRIVLQNGKLIPELSDALPEGISFFDTRSAAADTFYSDKMGSIANDESNAMLSLNTAFFKDFYVLHIKAKKVVEKPVHISHVFAGNESPAFIPYRLLIIAEELSESTVVESFHSDGQAPVFVSYVSEIRQEASSVLHTHFINSGSADLHLIHHREVEQMGNSIFNNSNLNLGDTALTRNDINCRLKDSGTETNLLGSYILSDSQHLDNHTIVDHQMPHCNSMELYKGMMMDRSHGVFNGKIFVRQDAQKTNAFQKNNNILLSDQATINTKPQLEIFADDVKCSHGSTVGQMDETALFYLKTRGIGQETAHKMLIQAFISEVHQRISLPAIRDYALKLLLAKLQNTKQEAAQV